MNEKENETNASPINEDVTKNMYDAAFASVIHSYGQPVFTSLMNNASGHACSWDDQVPIVYFDFYEGNALSFYGALLDHSKFNCDLDGIPYQCEIRVRKTSD